MTPSTAPADFVATLIALSAFVFGNEALANIIAPNAAIILGALVGSYFSSTKSDTPTAWSAMIHAFWVALLALMATVPLATAIAHYTALNSEWLLAPIAIFLGARNKKIPADINRAWEFIASVVAQRFKGEPKE